MMSSCGGGIARRRGDHDSVDKLAEFDKPIHWQPRISYNSRQPGLGRHPGRKNDFCQAASSARRPAPCPADDAFAGLPYDLEAISIDTEPSTWVHLHDTGLRVNRIL